MNHKSNPKNDPDHDDHHGHFSLIWSCAQNKDIFYYILSFLSVSDLFLDCSLVCKQWFHCLRGSISGGGGGRGENHDYFTQAYYPFLQQQYSHCYVRRQLPQYTYAGRRALTLVRQEHSDDDDQKVLLPFNAYVALSWTMFIPDRPYKTEQTIYRFMYHHVRIKLHQLLDDDGGGTSDENDTNDNLIQINLPICPHVDHGGLQPQIAKTMFDFGTPESSSSSMVMNGSDANSAINYVPVLVRPRSLATMSNEAVIHVLVDAENGSIAKMSAEECNDLNLENFVERGYALGSVRFLPRKPMNDPRTQKPSIQNREVFQSLLVALGLSETDESIPLATFILTIAQCLDKDALKDHYLSPKFSIKAFDHLYIDDISPYWFQVTRKLILKHDRLLTVLPHHLPSVDRMVAAMSALVQTKQYEYQMPLIMTHIATHGTVDMLSSFLEMVQLSNLKDPYALMTLLNRADPDTQSPIVGLLEGRQQPVQKFKLLFGVLEEDEVRHLTITHRVLHHAIRVAKICPSDILPEYHSLIRDILFEYLRWQQFPLDIHADSLCHNALTAIFPHFVHLLTNLPQSIKNKFESEIRALVNYSKDPHAPTPLLRAVLNFPQCVDSLLVLGADPYKQKVFEKRVQTHRRELIGASPSISFSAIEEASLCPQAHPSLEKLVGLSEAITFSKYEPATTSEASISEIRSMGRPIRIAFVGNPKCGKRSLVDRILDRPSQHLNDQDFMFSLPKKEQTQSIRYRSQYGLFNSTSLDIQTDIPFEDQSSVSVHLRTVHMFELEGLIESQPIKTAVHDSEREQLKCFVQEADIVFVCYDYNNECSVQVLEEIKGIRSLCSNDTIISIVGIGHSGDASQRRVFRSVVNQCATVNQVRQCELLMSEDRHHMLDMIKSLISQVPVRSARAKEVIPSYLPSRRYVPIDLSVLSPSGLSRALMAQMTRELKDSKWSQQFIENLTKSTNGTSLFNALSSSVEQSIIESSDQVSVEKLIAESKWSEVQLIFLIDVVSSRDVLDRVSTLLSTLSSTLDIGPWQHLLECLIVSLGSVYLDVSESVQQSIRQVFDLVRTHWIRFMNREENGQSNRVEQYLITSIYDRDFKSGASGQTLTQAVLFMLFNGFLHDVSFMTEFYTQLFTSVMNGQFSIVEGDFVESVSSFTRSRISEQCLYLIKQYNSREAQTEKVKKTCTLPIDTNVLVLVRGLTYQDNDPTTISSSLSANPIGEMSQITVPCEQVLSGLRFQNELNFMHLLSPTGADDFSPRISWLHQYGSAEVQFRTNYDVKILSVSTIQMSVLLLYNDPDVQRTGLTLQDILNKLLPESLQRSNPSVTAVWKSQILPLVRSQLLVTEDGSPFKDVELLSSSSRLVLTTKGKDNN